MAIDWDELKKKAEQKDARVREENRKANAALRKEPTTRRVSSPTRVNRVDVQDERSAPAKRSYAKPTGKTTRGERSTTGKLLPTKSTKPSKPAAPDKLETVKSRREPAGGKRTVHPLPDRMSPGQAFAYGTERAGASLLGAGEALTDTIGAGFYGTLAGVSSLGGLAENPVSRWARAQGNAFLDNSVTRDWEQSIEERYRPTDFERNVTGVGQAVVQMLPAIGTSKVVSAARGGASALNAAQNAIRGQQAGQALFGLQAAGQGAQEARQSGASLGQSLLYGASSGLMESLIERVSGGIPGLGKGVVDDVAAKVATHPLVRQALDMAGEGGEEAVSAMLEPFLKRAIYDPSAENATAEEIGQAAVMGALASGILKVGIDLPTAVGRTVANAQNARAQIGTNDSIARGEGPFRAYETLPSPNAGGQTNPASTGEAGLNENGLITLSDTERTNLSTGKKNRIISTFKDAVTFVRGALSDRQNVDRAYLGKLPDSVAQSIQNSTGLNVHGFGVMMNGDDIRHIIKSHGDPLAEQSRGQIAVTPDDIARIPEILAAPDHITPSKELDGKGRQAIVFEKQIGDTYITIQGVSDGKRLLQADTLYKRRARTTQNTMPGTPVGPVPVINAQGGLLQGSSSASIIPNTSVGNNPQSAPTGPESSVDGGPKKGTGGFGPNTVGAAESQFHSAPKVSRVEHNTFERGGIYNDVNRELAQAKPEDLTYDPISEQQSMSNALSRLMNDFDGERVDLPNKEAWSGEDLDTAMGILYQARQTGKQTGDYSEFNRWRKLIQEKGTNAGQMIQAFAKYTRTVDGILVEAATALDNSRLSDARKAEVLNQVQQQAQELEDIQDGDKRSVINLIKQNSNIRQTGTFFRNRISSFLDKALQADNFDHLRQVAVAQIDNIAKDHQRQSAAGRVRDLRSMFMLSNVATTLRNLVGNTVFGGLDSFAGNTGGVPLDILLSRFTGTRSVAAENPLSAAVRNGMADGAMKSYIEVALDADPSGVESRYGTTSNRSFKMTGSPLERFLSTWSKYMGYALNTTDEMAKSGVRAGMQEGIDRLTKRGLVSDDSLKDRADEMAKYRTFQDDTVLSKGMRGVRNALNHAGVGPAKGGSPHSFGAGDVLMPFDRVPANLVSRSLEYSPFGLAKGIAELADVLNKAHNGTLTAAEQARAVSDVSRGMTGTGLIAAFAAMAASGLLRVAGNKEGEEDKTSLETSEGLSGTQLNLSGLLRWIEDGNLPKMLPGGEAPDPVVWREGDTIMSIGFLDPINAQMTTGALLAQELQEGQDAERSNIFLKASLEGTLQSVLDLPAMSSLKELANGYSYSDAETTGGKVLDALTSYGASQASSFVPNIVRAAARAGDPYVRDAYSSGSTLGEIVDNVKMGIPGLRQTLPIRQTPFGEDRTYGDNRAMNALNALLLPGAINTYRTTEASQEIHMLPTVDDSPIYPRRNAPNKVSFNGADYELTAGQKTQYQKTYGQTYQQLIDDLRVSSYYTGLEPEGRTKLLSDARAYSNDKAKREALHSSGVEYKSSSWEKAYQAELAGVPAEVFLAYRDMRNKLEGSADKEIAQNANAIVRKDIMNDSGLTAEQKSTLDQYLLNDISTIPKDLDVDYTNEETFVITQMSDGAKKRWPGIKEQFDITPEQYRDAWSIYQNDDLNANEKRQMLRDIVGTRAGALYRALGKEV